MLITIKGSISLPMNHTITVKATIFTILAFILISFNACLPSENNDLPTLLEVLESDSKYSSYLELSNLSGRTADLDGSLFYTLFVPTNEALDSFKVRNGIDDFSELPDSTLSRLVWYHRQIGKIKVADMNSGYYTSLAGSYAQAPVSILFNLNQGGGDIQINQTAKLTTTDTEASDGIIHQMDEALQIPSIYDLLEQNGNFDIFLEAAERGGQDDLLKGETDITVFACPDNAWEEFFATEPEVDDLDDLTDNQLEDMIQYHILRTFRTSNDFAGLNFPTDFPTKLSGEPLKISASGLGGTITLDDSISLILLDIQGINGAIHFINDVLEIE